MTDSNDGPSTAAQGALIDASEPMRQRPSLLQRIFGMRDSDLEISSETQTAMEAASEAGAREMLVNLRNMRDMRVEDVAVPRPDIIALPKDAPMDAVMEAYRESGFTRLPIYNETLDDPIGFLHLKDVALKFGFGQNAESFVIDAHTRRILFVPPSMPLGALLQRMQKTRIHIALVIDEYGGVDGLVTIEDLLEEIVGDIEDEHDEEETRQWREESPGVYIANARAELAEFEAAAGVDLLSDELDEEVDTLGGLVFRLTGRVPERSEVVTHPEGHEFEVVDADARRIKRLRVRIHRDGVLAATTLPTAAE